jgi:hypothetical protein
MSDPQKPKPIQDRLQKLAWIKGLVGDRKIKGSDALTTLDKLGLDVPRKPLDTAPKPVTTEDKFDLAKPAAASDAFFESGDAQKQADAILDKLRKAPQAAVPEREGALALHARLVEMLDARPLSVKDARKALIGLNQALPVAIAAMKRVFDSHQSLSDRLAVLTLPDDADEKEDAAELAALRDLTKQISGLLGGEPSATGVETAGPLTVQAEVGLTELRKKINARIAAARVAFTETVKRYQSQLDTAGQADVPERASARKLRTPLDGMIAAGKLNIAATHAAVEGYGQAVWLAVEAMRRVLEELALVTAQAKSLASPTDVHLETDQAALTELADMRAKLAGLPGDAEPSAGMIDGARALIAAHDKAAEELRKAVAARNQLERDDLEARAKAASTPLDIYRDVADPALLGEVLALEASFASAFTGGLTVKAVEAARPVVLELTLKAAALLVVLNGLKHEWDALQIRLAAAAVPAPAIVPKEAQQTLVTAWTRADTANRARLSRAGIDQLGNDIGALEVLLGQAANVDAIWKSVLALVAQIGALNPKPDKTKIAPLNRAASAIKDLLVPVTAAGCNQANPLVVVLGQNVADLIADETFDQLKDQCIEKWVKKDVAYQKMASGIFGKMKDNYFKIYSDLNNTYDALRFETRQNAAANTEPYADRWTVIIEELQAMFEEIRAFKSGAATKKQEATEDLTFRWDKSVKNPWKDAEMNRLCGEIERPGQVYLSGNLLVFTDALRQHDQGASVTKVYLDEGAGSTMRGYFQWSRTGNVITVKPFRVGEEHQGGKQPPVRLEGDQYERK